MSIEAPAEGRRRQRGRRGDLTRFGTVRTVRGRDAVPIVRAAPSAGERTEGERAPERGAGRPRRAAAAAAESGAEG